MDIGIYFYVFEKNCFFKLPNCNVNLKLNTKYVALKNGRLSGVVSSFFF